MPWNWASIDWNTTAVVSAAWVQAVGSVGAIWLGWSVANSQTRTALMREERDRRERTEAEERDRKTAATARFETVRAHRRLAATLAMRVRKELWNFIDILKENPAQQMLLSEIGMSDLVTAERTLGQLDLAGAEHDDVVKYFTMLQGQTAVTIACLRLYATQPIPTGEPLAGFIHMLERSLFRVSEVEDRLREIAAADH